MISKRSYEQEIFCNPFGKGEFQNLFTNHAEESFKFLKGVRDKRYPYVSDFYAMVVNTMERFYKGIVTEYADNNPGFKYNESVMYSHRLDLIAAEVNEIFPIIDSDRYEFLVSKLEDFSIGYTGSRYKERYEFSDFVKAFDLFEKQREYLYKNFENIMSKDTKEIDYD